ncbi:MAG: hypothetical protein ACLROW_18945 [Roseburia faecis]
MRPPEIKTSTEEERRQYIKDTFPCIADCDMCGLCTVFRGKDPNMPMRIISAGSGVIWRCPGITGNK